MTASGKDGHADRTVVPDAHAMEKFGEHLAATWRRGLPLLLRGDLGAGKTTLVRGVAAGLGIDPDEVTSPTYALLHEYAGPSGTLRHFDLYRLADAQALRQFGFDELFDDQAAWTVIEWPPDGLGELLGESLQITIERPDLASDQRTVHIAGVAIPSDRLGLRPREG